MTYSSQLLEDAVNELAKLPGIGKRSALRMALYLLKQDTAEVELLSNAIMTMRKEIQFCQKCHNISDSELCHICSNPRRNTAEICVVQDIRDVLAIESTSQYKGVYHVLGGIISPIEGIGPDELNIPTLISRVNNDNVQEVIMALPTTIEGDTTIYYLFKKLQSSGVMITIIARGISIGDELEYADELTLGRSILNRTPYQDGGF